VENWRKFLTEDRARKVNIFLDMDGVLVNFPDALKNHIKRVYSQDPNEVHAISKSSRSALRKLQSLNLSDEEIADLYNRVEEIFQEGGSYDTEEKLMNNYIFKALVNNKELWVSMGKLDGADTVVNTAFDLADNVFVLTAQVDEASEEAKKEWIANHFPQINPKHVHVDRDKGGRLLSLISAGIVSEDDLNILIDDRQKFLNSFIGAGGSGIQYDFESPQSAFDELERITGN
jgi:5'(3')-deoxyribonucleotidase